MTLTRSVEDSATIAHGGMRRGVTVPATETELRDLERLRTMRRDLYTLTVQSTGFVSVTDLLYILDGDQ
jgi:hypothetical protein